MMGLKQYTDYRSTLTSAAENNRNFKEADTKTF
jgi:hypothetical protein